MLKEFISKFFIFEEEEEENYNQNNIQKINKSNNIRFIVINQLLSEVSYNLSSLRQNINEGHLNLKEFYRVKKGTDCLVKTQSLTLTNPRNQSTLLIKDFQDTEDNLILMNEDEKQYFMQNVLNIIKKEKPNANIYVK